MNPIVLIASMLRTVVLMKWGRFIHRKLIREIVRQVNLDPHLVATITQHLDNPTKIEYKFDYRP